MNVLQLRKDRLVILLTDLFLIADEEPFKLLKFT
jgi:hypothetical protein